MGIPKKEFIQVVLHPALRPAFEEWLAGRSLRLGQIPGEDSDELPTFIVTPTEELIASTRTVLPEWKQRPDQSEESLALDDSLAGVRLINLRQTCNACPSQWEALTNDGHIVYVRYRGGQLTVGIGATLELAVDGVAFRKKCGDGLDGYMTWDEVERHTGLQLKGS